MEFSYADRHIRSLSRARACAALGARIKTITHITGLSHCELVRLFFIDEKSAPRGRPPDSPDWYHQANLIEQVEASVFAAIFGRIRELGFGPADALIGAYRAYADHCARAPRVSFDRAFDLVCHVHGLWARTSPQLSLNVCPTCRSQYLAALGAPAPGDTGCPFCKIVKRYGCDKRVQATFPQRRVRIDEYLQRIAV